MDVYRSINTKFWSDKWIEKLDPIERLLYIYLLTNPQTSLAGVYELSIKRMAFETGIEQEVVFKILARFQDAGKIIYADPYIIVLNWIKNHPMNANMKKSVRSIISDLPDSIQQLLNDSEGFGTVRKDSEPFERIPNDSKGLLNASEGLETLSKDSLTENKEKEKEKIPPIPPYKEKNQKEKKESFAPSGKTASAQAVPDDKSLKIDFDFKTGKWLNIQKEDTAAWVESYPALDIKLTLNQIREWLKANPKQRKSNYRRFIANWLKKEQDRGGHFNASRAVGSSLNSGYVA